MLDRDRLALFQWAQFGAGSLAMVASLWFPLTASANGVPGRTTMAHRHQVEARMHRVRASAFRLGSTRANAEHFASHMSAAATSEIAAAGLSVGRDRAAALERAVADHVRAGRRLRSLRTPSASYDAARHYNDAADREVELARAAVDERGVAAAHLERAAQQYRYAAKLARRLSPFMEAEYRALSDDSFRQARHAGARR